MKTLRSVTECGGGEGTTVVRRRVIYHGRVQGVFFRATSAQLAHDRPVSGYVRNRPEGTVELEAQGPADAVDEFLAAVAGYFAANITRRDLSDAPPRAGERGFRIEH
ncbi:MAG TPA: acylphosphatase [Phycisphaerae bacterium]|nr:acylphosphatase [Phycisphaerae bacterium]